MATTTVVMCIDGLDPDYMELCQAPTLEAVSQKGFMVQGQAMMPTVTNVNNVSMVTASYPEAHGITSNYRLDRHSGQEFYMESAEFILAETIFQRTNRLGGSSILVTAKDKLRTLLGDGTTCSISSEQPPAWVVEEVGQPPPIYSLEVNAWVVDAASYAMSRQPADVVYIATTDYAMHTYSPQAQESQLHLTMVDEAIGRLLQKHGDVRLLITADHGMSAKGRMIDLKSELAGKGIQATAVPVIKDRYTVHHSNLGGSIYVYLDQGQVEEAAGFLREVPGVDDALTREQAASRFHLHPDRIGDLLVLGAPDVVFGDPAEVGLPTGLRSHGSLHEGPIPIMGCGPGLDGFSFQENRDLGRFVMEKVLA